MSLNGDIKVIEKLFKRHQDNFRWKIITDLLYNEKMEKKYLKLPLKDRFKEDKTIMTLNLVLQGFSHRRIGDFCGISHQAVGGRVKRAISKIKARYPNLDMWETPTGDKNMNVTLAVEDTFCASHTLVGYRGPCSNLHGHTWKVSLKISGCLDPETGILVDFHYLKQLMKTVLPDHCHLNDIKGLKTPTAEVVSVWLYKQFELEITEHSRETGVNLQLESVTVWESAEASSTYTGD